MFNFMRLPPLRRLMLMKAITGGGSWSTITGNPVTFSAIAAPLKQLQIAFSPVQSGTGDPSPDNVRPISGWDGVDIHVTGTNILDRTKATAGYRLDSSGGLVLAANDSVSDYIRVLPSTAYHFLKMIGSTGGYALAEYDENKTLVKAQTFYGSGSQTKTVTTQATTSFIRVCFITAATGVGINYPATETAFIEYNGRSISITIGQTVYSGKLDVLTGVLKVRPYFASYNGETLVGPWMSSMDKYVAGATPTVGAQVVDMGGAETTIQLTPQEVSSLLGENNMWSNANGNLTVTYAADPATMPIVGKGKVGQAIIGG